MKQNNLITNLKYILNYNYIQQTIGRAKIININYFSYNIEI